jgi:asparagine synthase (glutamine-hydrolysing)
MLDHRLAEVAAEVPFAWNLPLPGQQLGKRLFIRAMGDRLPAEIVNRRKMGFAVPVSEWFRTTLRDFLEDHLTSSRFVGRGIFSGEFVRQLIAEHVSGRRNNSHWLWMLLMFELWMRDWETERGRSPDAQISAGLLCT